MAYITLYTMHLDFPQLMSIVSEKQFVATNIKKKTLQTFVMRMFDIVYLKLCGTNFCNAYV